MKSLSLAILLLTLLSSVSFAATKDIIDTTTGMKFQAVPPGCFEMGDIFGDGYYNANPVHEVCLNGFFIGKYPVTKKEFRSFVDDTGYVSDAERGDGCYVYNGVRWRKDRAANWKAPGFSQGDDHPVVCVTWNDSMEFVKWLSAKSKRTYRLPSEAEWEYAARSGGKYEKYAGGNDLDAVAWYSANSGATTHAVGQKQANGLGIFDMSGNVWQWTGDWYDSTYYRSGPRKNPSGPPSGSHRVFRGGSWFYDEKGIRVSYRDYYSPGYRSSYLGFRLVTPGE